MVSLPEDAEARVSTNNPQSFYEKARAYWKWGLLAVLILLVLLFTNIVSIVELVFQPLDDDSICPVYDPIAPQLFYRDNTTVLEILHSELFRLQSAQRLSAAVQIDTTVFDNQPNVPDDPELWSSFERFHQHLRATYPEVFRVLKVDYVNTYGIVLHWVGTDPNLRPVMLNAHQDVVPVQSDTLADWSYPPFEGHYDGKYLYGRGSSDCKNVLVAILETFQLLIKENYNPHRGVVAAFGFDEEASGIWGARKLGEFLENKFGRDSFYAILDEGPGLMRDMVTGQIVALAATGEKGYVDLKVSLTTPGGHSSVPPDHTLIGIMGELAALIENQPFAPILSTKNPILGYMQCLAVNTGDKLPKLTRKAILRAGYDKFANAKVVRFLSKLPTTRYLVQTSQALDILRGGEKANALPENTQLVINHRISVESSVEEVKQALFHKVLSVAQRYDLGLNSFGTQVLNATAAGSFVLEVSSRPLEAAPVSPATGNVWKYLAGATRHIFEDLVFPNLSYPVFLAPAIMPANTDTRYYWNLSRNIFRYSPYFSENIMEENHVHSVDERVTMDGHLQLLAFFYEYLQVIDTPEAE